MTSIIVNQNYGHNLIKYFEYVKQKKKARKIIARAVYMRCRGTKSNAPEAQHGDFQTRFLKIRKFRDYKQLILFKFFAVFLVSFGTVWKYLTLTGTIWAQFN